MSDRIMGSDAAYAVGRFKADGLDGYRAKSAPSAPLRDTRAEAVEDERAWLNGQGETCGCGHAKAYHYAGECRHFVNPASVVCTCRALNLAGRAGA